MDRSILRCTMSMCFINAFDKGNIAIPKRSTGIPATIWKKRKCNFNYIFRFNECASLFAETLSSNFQRVVNLNLGALLNQVLIAAKKSSPSQANKLGPRADTKW